MAWLFFAKISLRLRSYLLVHPAWRWYASPLPYSKYEKITTKFVLSKAVIICFLKCFFFCLIKADRCSTDFSLCLPNFSIKFSVFIGKQIFHFQLNISSLIDFGFCTKRNEIMITHHPLRILLLNGEPNYEGFVILLLYLFVEMTSKKEQGYIYLLELNNKLFSVHI